MKRTLFFFFALVAPCMAQYGTGGGPYAPYHSLWMRTNLTRSVDAADARARLGINASNTLDWTSISNAPWMVTNDSRQLRFGGAMTVTGGLTNKQGMLVLGDVSWEEPVSIIAYDYSSGSYGEIIHSADGDLLLTPVAGDFTVRASGVYFQASDPILLGGTNLAGGYWPLVYGNMGGVSNAVDLIPGTGMTIETNANGRTFTLSSTATGQTNRTYVAAGENATVSTNEADGITLYTVGSTATTAQTNVAVVTPGTGGITVDTNTADGVSTYTVNYTGSGAWDGGEINHAITFTTNVNNNDSIQMEWRFLDEDESEVFQLFFKGGGVSGGTEFGFSVAPTGNHFLSFDTSGNTYGNFYDRSGNALAPITEAAVSAVGAPILASGNITNPVVNETLFATNVTVENLFTTLTNATALKTDGNGQIAEASAAEAQAALGGTITNNVSGLIDGGDFILTPSLGQIAGLWMDMDFNAGWISGVKDIIVQDASDPANNIGRWNTNGLWASPIYTSSLTVTNTGSTNWFGATYLTNGVYGDGSGLTNITAAGVAGTAVVAAELASATNTASLPSSVNATNALASVAHTGKVVYTLTTVAVPVSPVFTAGANYMGFTTNAAFVFADPTGVSATEVRQCVVAVTNSTDDLC